LTGEGYSTKKEHLDSYTLSGTIARIFFWKEETKKEHYYRRRTRIAMPFLIITMITSRAVRSYHHVSRISYSGVAVKGLF
jgi:hypothetical protein